MAELMLFHHALGQTPGFLAFANELRREGHVVHAPDLYKGRLKLRRSGTEVATPNSTHSVTKTPSEWSRGT